MEIARCYVVISDKSTGVSGCDGVSKSIIAIENRREQQRVGGMDNI